ncbi:MAG: hypothetical protein QOG68_280 [Solirubrobacteraceae bacterium]|nr:hypothetical protein [Solirubrobacteraceae bacterium]
MAVSSEQKQAVREFWEAEPCGSKHADAPEGSPEYFAEVERARYELEPFIARYARFDTTAGQAVLEIGVGLGTDFVNFARAGADLTGVDLTEHSIELVSRRLELEGLRADLRVADAERLPFDDASFDVVYSWGVLHHSPNPQAAIAEAQRVLKPGGRICVMLYGRRSWVGIGLWLRYALGRGRPWHSLAHVIANHMESPGTTAYTPAEMTRLFGAIRSVAIGREVTPYDRRVGGPLVRLLAPRLAWFLVAQGTKA